MTCRDTHLRRASGVSRWFFAALLLAASVSTEAAEEWHRLQAPLFGVVSQLGEEATVLRATEFNQFIELLRQVYPIDESRLSPLTIVLFSQERDFVPYIGLTSAGRPDDVAGFFTSTNDWSVIAMYGRSTQTTQRVIYHEATHWYFSASETEYPLWFMEGIAELFSTFSLSDGVAQWGTLSNRDFRLNWAPLQSLQDFLHVTKDQAIDIDTYYPQARGFMHYLMFADGGEHRKTLDDFLRQLQTSAIDTAFEAAFGQSIRYVDQSLQYYLRNGSYPHAEVPLQQNGDVLRAQPATVANVEFALARLAIAGGHYQLALAHAENVVAALRDRPEGYEMRAYAQSLLQNDAAAAVALDQAITRGTRDGRIYLMKARRALGTGQDRQLAFIREAARLAAAGEIEEANRALDSLMNDPDSSDSAKQLATQMHDNLFR
jgi:tetratricopeptide (TPR) repeat protein